MSDDPRRTGSPCGIVPRCYRQCRCSRWPGYDNRWGNPVNGVWDMGALSGCPTWTIVGNTAVNTPAATAELFTDPGLEGAYVGGLNVNLAALGAPTVAQSADVHGGAKSQEFTAMGAADQIYQVVITPADIWYRWSVWGKRTAGANGGTYVVIWSAGTGGILDGFITSVGWQQYLLTFRSIGAGVVVCGLARDDGAAFDTVVVDDASFQEITLSELFCTRDTGLSSFAADVNVTLTAGTQAGLVLCLDSAAAPANFIIAYHDGTNAILEKCVAGVYTTLISLAAAYAAGATLRVIKAGNNVSLYYNGVQIGATQVVADAVVTNNTRHGVFSTSPLNTLTAFNLVP